MSQLQVRDPQGVPIPGINIRIAENAKPSDQAIFDVFTDLAGNSGWPIPYWPVRDYSLYVNYANVNAAYQSASVYVTHTNDVAITLMPSETPGGSGLFLTSQYDHDDQYVFATTDGQPWLFAAYSMHLLISAIHNGQDVTGVLKAARDYGANALVTIGMHLSPWKQEHGFYIDPLEDIDRYQRELAQMFDLAASYNLRCGHAVLAD